MRDGSVLQQLVGWVVPGLAAAARTPPVRAPRSAPAESSSAAQAVWPAWAARWSGVQPACGYDGHGHEPGGPGGSRERSTGVKSQKGEKSGCGGDTAQAGGKSKNMRAELGKEEGASSSRTHRVTRLLGPRPQRGHDPPEDGLPQQRPRARGVSALRREVEGRAPSRGGGGGRGGRGGVALCAEGEQSLDARELPVGGSEHERRAALAVARLPVGARGGEGLARGAVARLSRAVQGGAPRGVPGGGVRGLRSGQQRADARGVAALRRGVERGGAAGGAGGEGGGRGEQQGGEAGEVPLYRCIENLLVSLMMMGGRDTRRYNSSVAALNGYRLRVGRSQTGAGAGATRGVEATTT